MDPLEFCDVCFARGKTNLCETCKGTFTKISPLHFAVQAKLDRILNKLDLRARLVDRRWTCVVDIPQHKEFLDLLWGIGVTVHTLDDHAKVLSKLYKTDVRKLGDAREMILSDDSWEEFDPKSRNWIPLKVSKKDDKFTGTVRLGNIVKSTGVGGSSHFRTNLDNGVAVLIPIEKRAAYNIASTAAEPITVSWKMGDTGEHVFIETKQLGTIPDEIFNFLERLGRKDRKIPDTLIFQTNDSELVKLVLGSIKIYLEKSSDVVTVSSKKQPDVTIPIQEIEKERLGVLLHIIKELGGSITTEKDGLVVSGKRGLVRVTFVEDDRSTQDGTAIRVSISALEEPSRFAEILSMIRKRLGLLELPLDTMIPRYWPIITDFDLQYVAQSAISWYGSNQVLACNIISEGNKFEKIKEWHSKIKKGKIRSSLDTITLGKIIKYKESTKVIR